MKTTELAAEIGGFLEADNFQDYAPNGLQVEGGGESRRILLGVTASQALLDRALERGADTVLVHHGWFWKGESPRVIGMKARRLRTLMKHDIALLAYHLPLDAHPEVGNNAEIARKLELSVLGKAGSLGLLHYGEPVDAAYMAKLYDSVTSLYRLDQRGAMATDGSQALGPLPAPAKALLFTLGGVWVLMAVYGGVQLVKKKNRQNSH